MLYFSEKWDQLEMDGLTGALTIVSQGRTNPPIILAYSFNEVKSCWEYEIFRAPGFIKLADIADDPERIWNARSNQRAVEIINADHDAATADILSDLSTAGIAGSPQCKVLFKGSAPANWDRAKLERFLKQSTVEVLREKVWEPKAKAAANSGKS
jgi:hypothetical protein